MMLGLDYLAKVGGQSTWSRFCHKPDDLKTNQTVSRKLDQENRHWEPRYAPKVSRMSVMRTNLLG